MNGSPGGSGLFDLNGRVALVTGATGFLGRSFARALAEAGASVWLAGRRKEALAELQDQLLADGLEARHVVFDITHPDEIRSAVSTVAHHHPRLDVLVNNAHEPRSEGFETVTGDRFASAARLASGAAHDVTIAALPLLDAAVPDGSPVVVNIASMYGSVSPDPRVYDTPAEQNPADYGAAKAGLLQYTRHAAVHLAPRGIRVNSISPGPFPSAARDELVARLAARVPIGRIGTPEELHTALLFLASPASSYVTGADIPVDGGWTAW